MIVASASRSGRARWRRCCTCIRPCARRRSLASRSVSRRDDQGGHQPQSRAQRHRGRNQGVRARTHGRAQACPRVVEIVDDLPKTTSGKIMRRLLQTTTLEAGSCCAGRAGAGQRHLPAAPRRGRSAAVLEVGAIWLRLSRGAIPRSTAEVLHERLQAMLGQLDEVGRFLDRDAFLAASEAYHAAVIDLAETSICRGLSAGCACASC